ncbi:hypothetical protein SUDANB171_00933 [Streptomyces sp. enrichment culture]|uniref:type I-E CRISPR-associated protein Cas5/CasD n=1 Tax=Streptomyces sp. enrichment culture TaxID=1795815 RepID=UPI003F546DBE
MATTPPRAEAVLLLRLAGPLQAWGDRSTFNRRETRPTPTKSGVIGLLAAAAGRARQDPVDDLSHLGLGIRVDQPGSLLRDYHTVSDYRGTPLPQAGVSAKGIQKPTSPAKHTHVTTRYYLQDAVFLAAVAGSRELLDGLQHAVRNPAFPLALGRRSCPPTQPLCLGIRDTDTETALRETPWQVSRQARERYAARWRREHGAARSAVPATVPCPVTLDDPEGPDVLNDVPLSFDPLRRSFADRRVRHDWFSVPTGFPGRPGSGTPDSPEDATGHDPFALLGW